MWLAGGGIYGCGCKRNIDFLILLIPTPLVSALYCRILTFCSFFKSFSFLNTVYRALNAMLNY